MRKIVLSFGSIIGLALALNFIITAHVMYADPDFKGNPIIGYGVQLLLFSLIYFGVKKYRDHHLNGAISFLKALKMGVLTALMAATVYMVVGLLYYKLVIPDFAEVFTANVIKNSPPDQVEAVTAQMKQFLENYKNPFFAIFITYMEVLPMGLLVAFASAFLVKKKQGESPNL